MFSTFSAQSVLFCECKVFYQNTLDSQNKTALCFKVVDYLIGITSFIRGKNDSTVHSQLIRYEK